MEKTKYRTLLLTLLTLFFISLYLFFLSYFQINTGDIGKDVILTYLIALITILSVTISLIIIGLQFIASRLSSRLLPFLFNSKETIIMLGLYVFTIFFNLLIVNFSQSMIFIHISSILFIVCLFYLVFFFFYIIENFNEERLINYTGKNTTLKIADENYSILKELCLGYINSNDLKKFYKAAGIIRDKLKEMLNNISKKEITVEYDYEARHKEVEEIAYFFISLYKQLFYEIINKDRQYFLNF